MLHVSFACIYTCILYQNVKFAYFVYQILNKVILRDEHDTDNKYRYVDTCELGVSIDTSNKYR